MIEKNFKFQKLSEELYILDIIRTDTALITNLDQGPVERHVFFLNKKDILKLQDAIVDELMKGLL